MLTQSTHGEDVRLVDEIHLWRASLAVDPACLAALARTLSEDEGARAVKFFSERDRNRFIAARGILRTVLGSYVRVAPDLLRFDYRCLCGRCPQVMRKPALTGQSGDEGIQFNLSHSRDIAVYAITRGRPVGVDVERIEPRIAIDLIAADPMGDHEVVAIRSLPTARQPRAFFRRWTRHEAYLKAIGCGLAGTPTPPGRGGHDPASWTIRDFSLGPRYAGAVAIDGAARALVWRRWTAAHLTQSVDISEGPRRDPLDAKDYGN